MAGVALRLKLLMVSMALIGASLAMPTIAAAQTPLAYFGGDIQNNPHVYLTFWGKNWNQHPGARTEMNKMFSHLSGSGWQAILTQYYDYEGFVSPNVSFDSWTDESINAPSNVNDVQIENEIEYAMAQRGWPGAGVDNMYVVLPAPGSTYESGFIEGCGAHRYSGKIDAPYFHVLWPTELSGCEESDPAGEGRAWAAALTTASHEYAETVTNPITMKFAGKKTGWVDPENIEEIGNKCWHEFGELSNGSYVQKLWSNRAGKCMVSEAAATQTHATVKQTLNGQPGYVTIGGNVYSGNLELDNLKVNVKLEKFEGGSWKPNQTLEVPLNDNYYQLTDYGVGKGTWKAKTIFPEQGAYAKSESGEHEFTIKDGYQLVAKHSGKCMDIQNAGTGNGAQLHQWSCFSPVDYRNQVFTLVPVGGGYVNIVPRHSGRCLDVTNVSTSDGARVQQWDCLGTSQSNQLWKVIDAGGGYVKFQAKHSGKCMDVAAADQNNGAAINQWGCGSGSNQQWSFKSVESSPVPSSSYITIKEELNGQPGFVSVYGNVTANGYAIPTTYMNINFSKETSPGKWDLIESVHPMLNNGSYSYDYFRPGVGNWKVKAVYPGAGPLDKSESGEHKFEIKAGYRFVYKHSNKCMTLSENKSPNGQAIIQWDCFSTNPAHGQVFTLHPIGNGYNKVIVNSTGKCVEVPGGSTSDGTQLVQWECPQGGGSNQHWRVVAIQGQEGWFALQAEHSNKCADVLNSSTANGVPFHQWNCYWGASQKWKFESVG